MVVLPSSNDWMPADDPYGVERLVPFHACRGAVVWLPYTRSDGEAAARDIGVVDDLWSRFSDPRKNGVHVEAVSLRGTWDYGYFWLAAADVVRLRVRRDDPAVMQCDTARRADPVSPAEWHRLGLDDDSPPPPSAPAR